MSVVIFFIVFQEGFLINSGNDTISLQIQHAAAWDLHDDTFQPDASCQVYFSYICNRCQTLLSYPNQQTR